MNTKKTTTSILLGLTTLSVLFLFNNCGDGFKKSGLSMQSSTSTTIPTATGSLTLSTPVANAMNVTELNKTFQVPVIIDRQGTAATKTYELKIASPEIDALDPMDGFKAVISPSTIGPGVNAAMITVTVGTLSPSFDEHFHVEAWDGTLIETELEVKVKVQPIIRFQVAGNAIGDANWSSNGVPVATMMNATRDISFVHHNAPGLQVIFENFSTTIGLIVHSGNAIPHQNTAAPLAKSADGTTVGGSYTPAPIIGNTKLNAPVYSHTNESATAARRLQFNVNL